MDSLGLVVRFAPRAAREGIGQLASSGLTVASSTEFRTTRAVPDDFDGADVQYFERFGIAILRRPEDAPRSMLRSAMARGVIAAVRAERTHTMRSGERAVGEHAPQSFDEETATWGLEATRVPESPFTGQGIKVAVLDTGFDMTHPDFRGRAITRKLFASGSSEDDTYGHGTHCIGTSCGPLRPGSGPRYGIAHEAEIYAGKVLGDDGSGADRSVIAGMDWAVEQGCQVISMSLGAGTSIDEQIGQACLDAGTLVVAASGNDSARPGRIDPIAPPANASTIMAVAALDWTLLPARFSGGGIRPGQEMDIAAPGVSILSSLPGGAYDRWDGTSMAVPHVAGVAALIAQSDSRYRGRALWARLTQLARPLPCPARDVGSGLLQAPLA